MGKASTRSEFRFSSLQYIHLAPCESPKPVDKSRSCIWGTAKRGKGGGFVRLVIDSLKKQGDL